jgi:hypothetical protein
MTPAHAPMSSRRETAGRCSEQDDHGTAAESPLRPQSGVKLGNQSAFASSDRIFTGKWASSSSRLLQANLVVIQQRVPIGAHLVDVVQQSEERTTCTYIDIPINAAGETAIH